MSPRADRLLWLETVLTVIAARLAITLLPFRLVHRFVATRRRRTPSTVTQEQIASAVVAVARRIPRANCLTQVLAAAHLSARHGHAATIRLGVTKRDDTLLAHAWLESDGRIILGEPEPGTFVMLTR